MSNTAVITTALVIGGCGSVGNLISKTLNKSGIDTTVIDLHIPDTFSREEGICYFESDIISTQSSVLEGSDLILLSLPIKQTLEFISTKSHLLTSNQCLIETSSVKLVIKHALEQHDISCECIGINPMFSPSLGFKGQNISWIEFRDGSKSGHIKNLLMDSGGIIIELDADSHDRQTSIIQCATHAAILAFGHSLYLSDYSISDAKKIWTPPHKTMLALLSRISGMNRSVFNEIQAENPYARDARNNIIKSLQYIADIFDNNSKENIDLVFEDILNTIKDEKHYSDNLCANIFDYMSKNK